MARSRFRAVGTFWRLAIQDVLAAGYVFEQVFRG